MAGARWGLHVSGVPLTDISNFVAVNEHLATAGQPSEEQLTEVATSGFEVVVNLGLLDPRYCLPDEAAAAARLGLTYRHVPVDFKAPTVEGFLRFEQVMADCAGQRVFVHCAKNYRVSCFVALYGEKHFGWSQEQALEHVRRVWAPDDIWRAFMTEVRSRPDGVAPGVLAP